MAKTARAKRKATTSSSKKKLPIGLILVGGFSVIVVLLVALISINQNKAASVESLDLGAYAELPPEWIQGKSLGNPEAKVTVQLWEDFLCPACARLNKAVTPRFKEEYVATGKVRLEYHQFPLSIHDPAATLAANASECAADQNAFWPYHDRLFQVADTQGASGFTVEKLIGYAGELGLDTDTFSQCMNSQKHWDEVRASVNQAIAMGLQATPSVLVNGQLMENPFDYDALTSEVDRLLEAAASQ